MNASKCSLKKCKKWHILATGREYKNLKEIYGISEKVVPTE